MSEEKPPHPFHRIHHLLHRIKDKRLRRLANFALLFCVSLAAGHVVELVTKGEHLETAKRAQEAWIHDVEAMTPLTLAKGYLDDIGPAMHGAIAYVRPQKIAAPALDITAQRIAAAKIMACNLARARSGSSFSDCALRRPVGVSASACAASPETAGCAAYNSCLSDAMAHFGDVPAECAGLPANGGLGFSFTPPSAASGDTRDFINNALKTAQNETLPHSRAVVPVYFAPIAALIRTVTRLFAEGGVATLAQLAAGALAFAAFVRDSKTGVIGFGGFLPNLMGAPPAVIAIASLLALGLKWLMLGALFSLHGVTSLAAAAAGAAGLGGFCWLCFSKLAEKGVEAAMTGEAV